MRISKLIRPINVPVKLIMNCQVECITNQIKNSNNKVVFVTKLDFNRICLKFCDSVISLFVLLSSLISLFSPSSLLLFICLPFFNLIIIFQLRFLLSFLIDFLLTLFILTQLSELFKNFFYFTRSIV